MSFDPYLFFGGNCRERSAGTKRSSAASCG